MNEIKFYSWKDKYFELSNFSIHPIVIDGKEYMTNEHYFQSVKFKDLGFREMIRLASSPKEAKSLGRSRDFEILDNWNVKRVEVMKKAIKAKFTQYEELKELLLSTGDAILKEDSPSDNFWGIGKYGTGKNMLGKLLMELRKELKN